jgi:predicted hotdog family 3-hydroxylacyl-ACP dehydratase
MNTLLPDIESLIPHRPPMLLLHSLQSISNTSIEALAYISEECLFLREDGSLEPVALIEILAQCFAAGSGIKHKARWGYLAAMRHIVLYAQAQRGDTLRAIVRPIAQVGNVIVVEGEIMREKELLAQGQFKIFIPPQGENAE